jgi:hypothetical protein
MPATSKRKRIALDIKQLLYEMNKAVAPQPVRHRAGNHRYQLERVKTRHGKTAAETDGGIGAARAKSETQRLGNSRKTPPNGRVSAEARRIA